MSADSDDATLQDRLEDAEDSPAEEAKAVDAAHEPSIRDPVALLHHLDVSGHFHRDGPVGRLYHVGQVSLRENEPNDSLHVAVDGNRMSAHVDKVSPLKSDARGRSRYSMTRAVLHNVAGAAHDAITLLRGRQGDHLCRLDCEWLTDDDSGPKRLELLDPADATWSVQFDVRVAGKLDEERMRATLGAVLGDDIPADERLVIADCAGDDDLDAARAQLQGTPVSLTAGPPVHACLAHHPGGDMLMLNINHAAADGFGALHVLRRIALAYTGDADAVADLDWLAIHDLPVQPAAAKDPPPVRLGKAAVERLRDLLARPAQIAPDEPGSSGGYGFHLVALSADDTRHVGRVEDAPGDGSMLMAALHLAIGDWNLEHGAPGRTVGVLAPANLRPDDWPEETIGNFSVTTRVSTSRRERSGAKAALKAIAVQSARNKNTRSGIALIAALRRSSLLTLWAKQSVIVLQPIENNARADAAMLCNLGWLDDPPRFGSEAGETLELWFSPPARSPQTLCLGAITVGERLHLTFRYPLDVLAPRRRAPLRASPTSSTCRPSRTAARSARAANDRGKAPRYPRTHGPLRHHLLRPRRTVAGHRRRRRSPRQRRRGLHQRPRRRDRLRHEHRLSAPAPMDRRAARRRRGAGARHQRLDAGRRVLVRDARLGRRRRRRREADVRPHAAEPAQPRRRRADGVAADRRHRRRRARRAARRTA